MTPVALSPNDQVLVEAARAALAHAFAPFSHFHVGAALRLVDGSIVSGCNIENATYGLTMCAERVALFTAIAGGARPGDFVAVAVVATAARATPPCGACRQLLWEFCGDIPVLCVSDAGAVTSVRVSELLPMPFDLSFLPETNDE